MLETAAWVYLAAGLVTVCLGRGMGDREQWGLAATYFLLSGLFFYLGLRQ